MSFSGHCLFRYVDETGVGENSSACMCIWGERSECVISAGDRSIERISAGADYLSADVLRRIAICRSFMSLIGRWPA